MTRPPLEGGSWGNTTVVTTTGANTGDWWQPQYGYVGWACPSCGWLVMQGQSHFCPMKWVYTQINRFPHAYQWDPILRTWTPYVPEA